MIVPETRAAPARCGPHGVASDLNQATAAGVSGVRHAHKAVNTLTTTPSGSSRNYADRDGRAVAQTGPGVRSGAPVEPPSTGGQALAPLVSGANSGAAAPGT